MFFRQKCCLLIYFLATVALKAINLNITLTIFSLIDGRFILPPTEINSNNKILKKSDYDLRC